MIFMCLIYFNTYIIKLQLGLNIRFKNLKIRLEILVWHESPRRLNILNKYNIYALAYLASKFRLNLR